MSIPSLFARIDGLFTGPVVNHWPGKPASGIDKKPVDGRLTVTPTGLIGDAQGDQVNHGGPDKALHHYAADHYSTWIAEQQIAKATYPAAFGENISTTGLTESNLCIGDILSLGQSTVQISQGRQPCWKLNEFHNNPKLAYLFQKTVRTGWYYRVLEPGSVAVGDEIRLIERPNPEWTVARITDARLSRRIEPKDALYLSELPELAGNWRKAFAKMASGDTREDTKARLTGKTDLEDV